jgi:hypothetical protein
LKRRRPASVIFTRRISTGLLPRIMLADQFVEQLKREAVGQ